MATQKPSDRRKGGLGEPVAEPDLTPIMNLTFMLILALLTMASLLPLGLITIQAPQLGGGGGGAAAEDPEKKKLNLTIFIKMDGFDLAASGATLTGESEGRAGQRLLPQVAGPDGQDFDYAALSKRLLEIKKAFKNEEAVIIVADPDVVYEAVVRTMDAAREIETQNGSVTLFPAVAFSPGIVG